MASVATLFAMGGAGVAIVSGVLWRRYKLFHVVPWLYGAVGHMLMHYFYHRAEALDFVQPLLVGGVFYALAWISTIETKKRFGI